MDYFRAADVDMSKSLSLTEVKTAYHEEESFRSFFVSQDMDLPFLEYAFKLALKGGKEEEDEVSFEDFAESVISMKNSDTGPVMALIKCQVGTIVDKVNTLQDQVLKLTADLSDHMAINARAYNRENGENGSPHNDGQKGNVLGGTSWWSRLTGHQPINSKQAEPQHYSPKQSLNVHGSIDVDQVHSALEDPIHQSEEDVAHQEAADEWSDPAYSDPEPKERGPDLAELLKSAYGNPLPLDLPNLDDVQRNFAKLCERVETQLDRLDNHWIDDTSQSRAQSKRAAGTRLLGCLGRSMTGMLNASGAPPPKPKLRRRDMEYWATLNAENNASAQNDIPIEYSKASAESREYVREPSANSRTSADSREYARELSANSPTSANSRGYARELSPANPRTSANAVQRCSGTCSAATEEVVHEARNGRHIDQHERGAKGPRRPRSRKRRQLRL